VTCEDAADGWLAVAVGFEAAATAIGRLRTFEDKAGLWASDLRQRRGHRPRAL